MSTAPFDTYAAVKRLTATGVPEAQAEALIRAVTDANARADLATKSDLEVLRGDITGVRNAFAQEFEAVRREMATKTELADLRNDLIRWVVGLMLPLYAVLIAILLALLNA